MEKSNAYDLGHQLGFWVSNNRILAAALGILFLSLFVYTFIKVIKQMRNFGE